MLLERNVEKPRYLAPDFFHGNPKGRRIAREDGKTSPIVFHCYYQTPGFGNIDKSIAAWHHRKQVRHPAYIGQTPGIDGIPQAIPAGVFHAQRVGPLVQANPDLSGQC